MDPLHKLTESAAAMYICRDMYRGDAEHTARILRKVRTILARVEWEIWPDIECTVADEPQSECYDRT